jgi:hypothetical protein
MKKPMNFRLTEEGRAILDRLAALYGISKTAVLEIAIRHLAQAPVGRGTVAPAKDKDHVDSETRKQDIQAE